MSGGKLRSHTEHGGSPTRHAIVGHVGVHDRILIVYAPAHALRR